jgi:hypothetical protein
MLNILSLLVAVAEIQTVVQVAVVQVVIVALLLANLLAVVVLLSQG